MTGRTDIGLPVLSYALRRAHGADLSCLDRMPVCPRCHDMSEPGATRCETCGGPLLMPANWRHDA
jgi:predicted amidophosphoribosyltransferase